MAFRKAKIAHLANSSVGRYTMGILAFLLLSSFASSGLAQQTCLGLFQGQPLVNFKIRLQSDSPVYKVQKIKFTDMGIEYVLDTQSTSPQLSFSFNPDLRPGRVAAAGEIKRAFDANPNKVVRMIGPVLSLETLQSLIGRLIEFDESGVMYDSRGNQTAVKPQHHVGLLIAATKSEITILRADGLLVTTGIYTERPSRSPYSLLYRIRYSVDPTLNQSLGDRKGQTMLPQIVQEP
jgi:hypothetical protein